jgi:hypothetical protein
VFDVRWLGFERNSNLDNYDSNQRFGRDCRNISLICLVASIKREHEPHTAGDELGSWERI